MTTDTTEQGTEESSSEDAFAVVGNEIRAEIIRTLGDARVAERSAPVLPFSELRSRTDADVGSAQFNYHLQQLVGHFLERTDEGYRMRPEGRRLYQLLRAGTLDRTGSSLTADAEFDCYYCETPVEATIDDGTVTVQCPGCEYLYDIAGTPPGAVADDAVSLSQVARYAHHEHLGFARGVCTTCGNALDTEFLSPEEAPFPGAERHEVYVYRSCANCGDQRFLSVGEALLADEGLVSFCHDNGVDVLSTPLWELAFAATDRGVTVDSRDPWEVTLQVTYDGDTLELIVDDDLTVIERTGP